MIHLRHLLLLGLLLFPVPATSWAQQVSKTISSVTDVATFTLGGGTNVPASFSVQTSGAWIGVIQFQGSVNGTLFAPIRLTNRTSSTTNTTAAATNASYGLINPGFTVFKVVATSWTTGTVQITVLPGPDVITVGSAQSQVITSTSSITFNPLNPTGSSVSVFMVGGTWTGTLAIEVTTNGSSWSKIAAESLSDGTLDTDFTANDAYRFINYGYLQMRLRPTTAWTGVAAAAFAGSTQTVIPVQPDVSSSAPASLTYIVKAADASLPNAQSLGTLTTGIVLNTVTGAAGLLSIYPGGSCTNQFPRSFNASMAPTCASVANADLAGSIAASKLIGTDINSVGTVVSGTWNAGTVRSRNGDPNARTVTQVVNSGNAGLAEAMFNASNETYTVDFGITGTAFTTSGVFAANTGVVHSNALNGLTIGTNTGPIIISAQDDITSETARFSSGRFGIGLIPSYKVDVRTTTTTGNVTGIRLFRDTGAATNTSSILWQSDTLQTASISDELVTGTTSAFSIKTNNAAGLVERFRVNPSGTLKASAYVAGIAQFDASGNIASTVGITGATCSAWTLGLCTSAVPVPGPTLLELASQVQALTAEVAGLRAILSQGVK